MEFEQAILRLGLSEKVIQFNTTPGRAFILIAQLQLALRHPQNTGESAAIARQIVEYLLDAVCWSVPEVEAAVRNAVEQGWNAENDLTREEFERLFPLLPPEELE